MLWKLKFVESYFIKIPKGNIKLNIQLINSAVTGADKNIYVSNGNIHSFVYVHSKHTYGPFILLFLYRTSRNSYHVITVLLYNCDTVIPCDTKLYRLGKVCASSTQRKLWLMMTSLAGEWLVWRCKLRHLRGNGSYDNANYVTCGGMALMTMLITSLAGEWLLWQC